MNTTKRLLLGALAAMVGGTAQAQPPAARQLPPAAANQPLAKAADVRVGTSGELLVPTGGIVRFKPNLRLPFKDVLTANDNIVQVRPDPTDDKAIELVGLTPGITRLTFTLTDGSKGEYEVVVQPDYEQLRRVIAKAVPTASIEVIPGVGNSIILAGYVNRPEDAETVMLIARASTITSSTSTQTSGSSAGVNNSPQPGVVPGTNTSGTIGVTQSQAVSSTTTAVGTIVNAIQIGGLQHVQIEVVFASVNRSKIRQRGADFNIAGNDGSFSSIIANLLVPGIGSGGGAGAGFSNSANLQIGIAPAGIFLALQALKDEQLAKFLSEPKIVTQSGRPAVLRSGGRQAVLGPTAGLGGVSVILEPVGTTMNVLPIVYGNGKIYLEVNPSIVTPNAGLGIIAMGNLSTGFSEQSVSASVMLESGQTFAIGGLLETQVTATSRKLPVVGEIPYIGSLFSQQRNEERETELVILVTPRLVDALDCSQTPKRVPGRETRGPDDYEFFLEGLLEAPRGQRQVWNGKCYQAAYKCDPTYGVFPCKGNVCGAGGNCGANGSAPTNLPTVTTIAAPVAPVMPALMPAPASSTSTPAAAVPVAEPIVMPQAPSEPAAPPILVPGPVAPVELPTAAPLTPDMK